MEELELFIDEVRDLLNEMELSFLSAENSNESWQEAMLNAFRGMHTIKANSMYLDYEKVSRCCHLAEGFLANEDHSPRRPEPEEFEILLNFVDCMNHFIEELGLSGEANQSLLNSWIFSYDKYIHGKGINNEIE